MNDTIVERNTLSFHALRAKFHHNDKKNDTLVKERKKNYYNFYN